MSRRCHNVTWLRKATGGSGMAEFAPALMIFFMVMVFPLLNLIGLGMGAATIQLIATQTAQAAANSSSYTQALTSMVTTSNNLMTTGFAKFAKLTPVGGYTNCGADLYVAATNISSKAVKSFGPNTVVPGPIDETNNIYEYQVKVTFQVNPFINMAGIPFVGQIPGVGKPTQLQYTAQRAVEYPDGLTAFAPQLSKILLASR